MRDTQKAKLYRADDVLRLYAVPLPTTREVRDYVRKVWASKRLRAKFPVALRREPPEVRDGRGRRGACAWGGYAISMPKWSRTSDVVLHELSHIIATREVHKEHAAHGHEFAAVFLTLALHMLGREAHDAFKASLKAHRVRFRPKRKLSPQLRAQRAETLRLYRERGTIL